MKKMTKQEAIEQADREILECVKKNGGGVRRYDVLTNYIRFYEREGDCVVEHRISFEPETPQDPRDKEIERLRGLLTEIGSEFCLQQNADKHVLDCPCSCADCQNNKRIIYGEQ